MGSAMAKSIAERIDELKSTLLKTRPSSSPVIREIESILADVRELERNDARNAKILSAHIEQRLLTWRQRIVNRAGDRLALDDYMNKEAIADLIDFVCDESAIDAAISKTKGST